MSREAKAKWLGRGAEACWLIAHVLAVPANLFIALGDRLQERSHAHRFDGRF